MLDAKSKDHSQVNKAHKASSEVSLNIKTSFIKQNDLRNSADSMFSLSTAYIMLSDPFLYKLQLELSEDLTIAPLYCYLRRKIN